MKKLLFSAALLALSAAPAAAQTVISSPQKPGDACQGFSFRTESSSIFGMHDYPQITAVHPGSPAEASGLRAGDLLVKRNGHDMLSNDPPPRARLAPGDTVRFVIRRSEQEQTLQMIAGEMAEGANGALVCRPWTGNRAATPPAARF